MTVFLRVLPVRWSGFGRLLWRTSTEPGSVGEWQPDDRNGSTTREPPRGSFRYPPNLVRGKLNSRYIGPYLVTSRLGEVTYQIQKTEKSPSLVVHADHLKLFHTERPPQSWLPPMVPGDEQRDRQTQTCRTLRVQELCESRGGRPGLSVLTSLLVSVDVNIY